MKLWLAIPGEINTECAPVNWFGVRLSKIGEKQADGMAQYINRNIKNTINIVLTATYDYARQTGEIIASIIAKNNNTERIRVVPDTDFNYREGIDGRETINNFV